MQDERGDTEYDHEETDFKKTEAGVFPELEIEEWTGGSPWKSSSLSEINHDHNRDLLVSIKRPREREGNINKSRDTERPFKSDAWVS
jgi:hypothetical protein